MKRKPKRKRNRPPRVFKSKTGRRYFRKKVKGKVKRIYIKSTLTNKNLIKVVVNNFIKQATTARKKRRKPRRKTTASAISSGPAPVKLSPLALASNSLSEFLAQEKAEKNKQLVQKLKQDALKLAITPAQRLLLTPPQRLALTQGTLTNNQMRSMFVTGAMAQGTKERQFWAGG